MLIALLEKYGGVLLGFVLGLFSNFFKGHIDDFRSRRKLVRRLQNLKRSIEGLEIKDSVIGLFKNLPDRKRFIIDSQMKKLHTLIGYFDSIEKEIFLHSSFEAVTMFQSIAEQLRDFKDTTETVISRGEVRDLEEFVNLGNMRMRIILRQFDVFYKVV